MSSSFSLSLKCFLYVLKLFLKFDKCENIWFLKEMFICIMYFFKYYEINFIFFIEIFIYLFENINNFVRYFFVFVFF